MTRIIRWITSTAILHNILADFGDDWSDQYLENGPPGETIDAIRADSVSAKTFREKVKASVLSGYYNLHSLPTQ